ncbi:GNAT family N-acetyltransferase [Acetobacterium paludosum]|uniref:GNAT family N-acetyltransferase n=1 Tax=Acetobacterium paludosum TaxID=52693 RepID=A0A923I103_9FIRM|nr:GNAT family protein [Acetobacterium paludosum]MBC3888103.1 GNAT family N-acetyltransferase [Acetobacterium paludosum]
MLRLRPYKTNDAEYIISWLDTEENFMKWCANLLTYPLTKEALFERQNKFDCSAKGLLWTAVDELGKPVGSLTMLNADYENNSIHFGFIIIDSSTRNMGYGKKMISLAVDYAFNLLKMTRITLRVFDNNPGAYNCYHSVGFKDEVYEPDSFPYYNENWGSFLMSITK